MDMEVILSDISTKVPCLQCIFRPEYAPYFQTAGTVLLGWVVVCWLLNLVWTFLAPLAISILGVIIVCPTTAKWLLAQLGPSAGTIIDDFLQRVQSSLIEIR